MPLRRKKNRETCEPNVGPFSDIAFLLIIFFILTSTLSALMGNKLDIPAARENPSKSKVEQPTITLSPEMLAWGKQQEDVTLPELRAKLMDLDLPKKPQGKRVVILDCAPQTSYQKYFEVVMAIEEAGGVLGMITEPGEKASED
ncbi:MAG: biopolymer transporter ExbD [Phycisphaerales bacterium]|jgi:biopolymer transport protein ExbD|nr:biopolymer transporter ExbD [Phycisphaerales bacterium]